MAKMEPVKKLYAEYGIKLTKKHEQPTFRWDLVFHNLCDVELKKETQKERVMNGLFSQTAQNLRIVNFSLFAEKMGLQNAKTELPEIFIKEIVFSYNLINDLLEAETKQLTLEKFIKASGKQSENHIEKLFPGYRLKSRFAPVEANQDARFKLEEKTEAFLKLIASVDMSELKTKVFQIAQQELDTLKEKMNYIIQPNQTKDVKK